MKIPPIGLYDTQIQQAFTTQLTNVETKGTSPDDAYSDALDADRADHRLTDHRAADSPARVGGPVLAVSRTKGDHDRRVA